MVLFLLVPPPTVAITREPTDTLYAGTTLTLTCSIELREQVDSPVSVTASWTGPGGLALSNMRTNISEAVHVGGLMYESRAVISPLGNQTVDGGVYTCTAMVTVTGNGEYIREAMNNNTINITITGDVCCSQ